MKKKRDLFTEETYKRMFGEEPPESYSGSIAKKTLGGLEQALTGRRKTRKGRKIYPLGGLPG